MRISVEIITCTCLLCFAMSTALLISHLQVIFSVEIIGDKCFRFLLYRTKKSVLYTRSNLVSSIYA